MSASGTGSGALVTDSGTGDADAAVSLGCPKGLEGVASSFVKRGLWVRFPPLALASAEASGFAKGYPYGGVCPPDKPVACFGQEKSHPPQKPSVASAGGKVRSCLSAGRTVAHMVSWDAYL
jgi:hypothetical protein